MSLAEKFQITIPPKKDDSDSTWASFGQNRDVSCCPLPDDCTKFNNMPSLHIEGKYMFARGFGGDSDVSGGVNPESLKVGFHRREMKATDDQYGGEHVDLFYGEAVDEDRNRGFAERNNYLDRI
jgi:hypothetical protein